ncbi:Bin/amphiphysin/Rvs domain for vesicular trafficking-domain-containing protein [Trametes polyzona]|nr:Bin/amphiphysin/Rvs domain for vesicular trafficking-domain-containing protein [Trametes polyzona]
MDGWNTLSSRLAGLNLGQSANDVQATRERLGRLPPRRSLSFPRVLEARVDALRAAHLALLKITKVYESETYDYPTQIQESITELGTTIGHGITNFAAANLKGTALPAPAPAQPNAPQHKTLPHAIGRAATNAATAVQQTSGAGDDKLGKALQVYAGAWEKIADARVEQDGTIRERFLQPWQTTLSTSINVAMKARQAVRVSRLELDAAKQTLKNASPAKQEAARLEVENAEDDLVQKTEVAITLMKTVLDNLMFYATAAEALSSVQGEIEELSVAAEGEYRKTRDH